MLPCIESDRIHCARVGSNDTATRLSDMGANVLEWRS